MDARLQHQGPGHGPSRVLMMQDQKDPSAYITLIFFESEAKARENEGSPEQVEIQQQMMQIREGPPEFTDLNVIYEVNR